MSKQYTIGPYFSIKSSLSIRENEDEVLYIIRVLSIRENEDEVEEEDHLLLQIGTTNICVRENEDEVEEEDHLPLQIGTTNIFELVR